MQCFFSPFLFLSRSLSLSIFLSLFLCLFSFILFARVSVIPQITLSLHFFRFSLFISRPISASAPACIVCFVIFLLFIRVVHLVVELLVLCSIRSQVINVYFFCYSLCFFLFTLDMLLFRLLCNKFLFCFVFCNEFYIRSRTHCVEENLPD